jgi:hypothetical protein
MDALEYNKKRRGFQRVSRTMCWAGLSLNSHVARLPLIPAQFALFLNAINLIHGRSPHEEAAMSEHEVPLEELNEHIQHHAHESKEKWINGVALSTAFLAAFAAVAALLSSHYEGESMKEHSEAFDKWAYYQSKGIESLIVQTKIDTFAAMGKPAEKKDADDIAKYKKKREESETEAKHLTEISEAHASCQERFALGVTMFQMSIAIGAISVLTRRRGFWYVSLLLGGVGLFFLIWGYKDIPAKDKPHEAPSAEHAPVGEHAQ